MTPETSPSAAAGDHRPSPADLAAAARAAMVRAHAPYSRFPVGAAVLSADGRVFAGANCEVASYPEGWCAETSALAQLVAAGAAAAGPIRAVAVAAERMDRITPCGGCRQRLAEFGAAGTLVHLTDAGGVVETLTLGALLPHAFDLTPDGAEGAR